jgi:predicted nucleotidyltransferase
VRRAIEVDDDELAEARRRRDAIAAVLRIAFPGARIYVNGSIAHGDALTPLTDVDLGVVVPNPRSLFGPGAWGPSMLKDRAAAAIRTLRGPRYPNLVVEEKNRDGSPRKRSILVRFGDPVTAGQPDFTADVIVAIDNPRQAGLFIPKYDQWDRSHPEKHTELVREANRRTRSRYARTVRLVKHWNRRNGKTLCSWNIKALALDAVDGSGALFPLLTAWFDFALAELSKGETADPAHVANHPIALNAPRSEVLRRLRDGRALLQEAAAHAAAGRDVSARDALARFFKDDNALPRPTETELRLERSAPAVAASRPSIKPVRSWAP